MPTAKEAVQAMRNEFRRLTGRAPVPKGPNVASIRPSDGPSSSIAVAKQAMAKDLDPMYTRDALVAEKQAADAKANRQEAEAEGQKYAKGGAVKARGDGAAQRGLTKGKYR